MDARQFLLWEVKQSELAVVGVKAKAFSKVKV